MFRRQLPRRDYQTPPGGPIRVPAIAATRHRVEELLENLDIEQLVNNSADTLAAVNGPGQTLRSEA